MILNETHHRWLFLIGLCLVAIGLPLSKAFMSIGGITLAVNFLLEGNLKAKFRTLISSPIILLLISVFIMHLVALIWTSDFGHAMKDIRIKLPLLLFPIIIPLSKPLSKKELHLVLGVFASTVLLTSFLSTWEYFQTKDNPSFDFRSISLFTSHIRYALMVCIAYLILLNLAWNEKSNASARVSYILLAVWLSIFVFILQSMTGIVAWLLCSYLLLIYTLSYIKISVFRIISLTVITIAPLIIGSYIAFHVDAFYPNEQPDFSELKTETAGGAHYDHDTNNLMLENGHYININIANYELEKEWNQRSNLTFWDSLDRTQQPINATIIRYLTSKGLTKDSVGINALTDQDILAIENGVANVRFLYGNPIDNRVYTVIWEFDRMMNEKRVQGHSVTQRFLFWKTGFNIFKENWLFGTGTGDINASYEKMYNQSDTEVNKKYRLRAHNQFLAFGVTFGVLGLSIFLLSIILPFITMKSANSFLYIGFAIVIYASMLNEDTLETQTGVTLYAFFNVLLLFGIQALSEDDSTSS